jgi:hypothetical protein
MASKRALFFIFFGIAMCFCAMTSAAQAQATRTWVSGVGDDANPCSRTAPCKTFAGAYSRTAAGGEIDALDPGGFGTLTASKAITIDGGGGQVASVLASGTNGINVTAGANDRIVLRNLRFNGINAAPPSSPGINGINFVSGGSLAVENCVIEGFGTYGINFQPNVRANLTVSDTVFVGNGTFGTTASGAIIATTAASSGGFNRVTVERAVISNGTSGIQAGNNTKMDVDHVSVSQTGLGGGDYGLISNGATAEMSVDYSIISGNNFGGLHATNSGKMYVANSSITYNNTNGILSDAGGQVLSYLNNRVIGNSGVQTFAGPVPGGQT